MNRFAAAGLLMEAAKGKRILVLTPPARPASAAAVACLLDVPEVADSPSVWVSQEPGYGCIDLGGRDRVEFRSVQSSLRGMSADVVYIDDEADRRLDDRARDELYGTLGLVVSSSPDGQIVRS